jgi:hypothetical protein
MAIAQAMDKTWNSDFPKCIHEICVSEQSALTL